MQKSDRCYTRSWENFFLVGELQSDLQLIGSAVATPNSSASERKMAQVKFNPEKVTRLENLIDEFDAQLPPLTTFILCPGLFTALFYIMTFLSRSFNYKV